MCAAFSQHALGALEGRPAGHLLLRVAEHRVEDGRVLQVARHAGVRDGDESEPGVLDAPLQGLGDDLADAVGELAGACGVGHDVLVGVRGAGPAGSGRGEPGGWCRVDGFGLLSLVGVVPDPLPDRQEVDFGAAGDQPFAGVEHLPTVPGIGGDYTHAELGAAVQVEVARLGGAHGVGTTELRDDRPDERALLLEGVHVAQQQVQAQGPDEHLDPSSGKERGAGP
jgi:hypothetical protein